MALHGPAEVHAPHSDGSPVLSRADLLGDPFEGSVSLANADFWRQVVEDPNFRKEAFGDMDSDAVKTMRDSMSAVIRSNVRNNFISCWHAAEHESAAMWNLYARSGEAVAVQTTFEKLANELPTEALMGLVEYIDYTRDLIDMTNMFNPFLRKRRSFEHEKEVRAIIWSGSGTLKEGKSADGRVEIAAEGATISVNLESFIERVLVGPAAPSWFADVIENVVQRYELNVPVQQSSLVGVPVY